MGERLKGENTIGPEGSQEERERTRISLFAAFVAALLVRAAVAWYCGAAQPQEIRYITIARGIISGHGFTGLDTRYPDIIQPPLYPMILAAAFLLPGPELALARAVSALMGGLLVLTGGGIARRLLGDRVARRTGWLIAFYPLLAHMSGVAITESTFTTLVTSALLVLWTVLDAPPGASRSNVRLLGVGLLLGLAYLTRPEGLAYAGAAVFLVVACASLGSFPLTARLRSALLAVWIVAGFLVAATPYLAWVRSHTGRWLLAPKAVLVEVHHSLIQEGQRENWKEPYDSPLFYEHVRFSLNKDATNIRSREQFAESNVGVTRGLLASDEGGDVSLFEPKMAARMVLKNLQEIYLESAKDGFVIPTFFLLLAGVGLVSRPWVGALRRATLITIVFFCASFSFLLTHVESRFLYPALPYAIPWIAEGWRKLELWLLASFPAVGAYRAAMKQRFVKGLVTALMILLSMPHLVTEVRNSSGRWAEHREMGLWVKRLSGPSPTIMAVAPVTAYYTGGKFEVLPYAEIEEVVTYARHVGAEYLVVDRAEIPRLRPQLTNLLVPSRPHPGLELANIMHERTRHAVFLYRVTKEDVPAR